MESGDVALSDAPDVIVFNALLGRLYVAIGGSGLIDVLDMNQMKIIETIRTQAGAHTIAFDASRNEVCLSFWMTSGCDISGPCLVAISAQRRGARSVNLGAGRHPGRAPHTGEPSCALLEWSFRSAWR